MVLCYGKSRVAIFKPLVSLLVLCELWNVWLKDSAALRSPGVLFNDAPTTISRNSDVEFYRLLAIFSISTSPNLLSKFPSLSTYFPPPSFVSSDHDWTADYIGYSGWIRNPKVLARLLRWVSKRVVDSDIPRQDSVGKLPDWYKQFRWQEEEQNLPVSGFDTILRPLVPPAYFEYLRNLFEQMALICANAAQNGASVEWTSGVLGWWIIGIDYYRRIALDSSADDVWAEFETAWMEARNAMHHLFLSWVR